MQPQFTVLREPSEGSIYAIVSKTTGGRYVGQTRGLIFVRWVDHLRMLQSQTHHCLALQHAWTRFGGHDFEWSVLEAAPYALLRAREQYWMARYRSEGVALYNATHGLRRGIRIRVGIWTRSVPPALRRRVDKHLPDGSASPTRGSED